MRRRNKNKIIILILMIIVCMMGVGYAAFQTKLDIKGSTEISSDWNIRIISAEVKEEHGQAENVKNTYTDLTANLEANLYSKGDYVEYSVIVENAGTFDAKLDTLGITNSNSGDTWYAITSKNITITFDKNGASAIGATSKSCIMYNTNKEFLKYKKGVDINERA